MVVHVLHRAQIASEAAAVFVSANLLGILLGSVDGVFIIVVDVETVVDNG